MTTATENTADAARWDDFVARPASYAHPARVELCFGGRIRPDLCRRLTSCGRLLDRVSERIRVHYGLSSRVPIDASDATDRAIALAPVDHIFALARRAGAMFHATTIANVIRADHVVMLHQQLGEELCAFAIAHRDLSGPSAGPVASLQNIGARVEEAGWLCVGAWCHAQPHEIGMRTRLKFAPTAALEGAPSDVFKQLGCAIMRRAIS
jgi:hypothetical protein